MKRLFAVALLMPLSATAQERLYTVQVTASQVNTIAKALRELPYKEVAGLLELLGQQIDTQNKAQEPPKPEPEK